MTAYSEGDHLGNRDRRYVQESAVLTTADAYVWLSRRKGWTASLDRRVSDPKNSVTSRRWPACYRDPRDAASPGKRVYGRSGFSSLWIRKTGVIQWLWYTEPAPVQTGSNVAQRHRRDISTVGA